MPDTDWLLAAVATLDEAARAQAIARQNELTKPRGSLGRLETIATDFAAWQGQIKPSLDRIGLTVFAGDHGVAARGVSAFPQAVTAQMVTNFATGGAAVCVLAREQGAEMTVVNLGTVRPTPDLVGVHDLALAPGTADFTVEAAMKDDVFAAALAAGAACIDPGFSLFIGGEMGIGNTTSAAAVWAALDDLDGAATVGHGTGVDETGLARKAETVDAGLACHRTDLTDLDGPIRACETLRRLGGLEIAALAGALIAAAQQGVPVVVDGFIASAAARAAVGINPGVADWLIFAHYSAETGHARLLASLGAEPLLDLGMRLGEGSGAMMAVPVIRNALALHAGMATFAEAGLA